MNLLFKQLTETVLEEASICRRCNSSKTRSSSRRPRPCAPVRPRRCAMAHSNSKITAAPTHSRLWLASILNPALDVDSIDPSTHSAPALPASASGRSLGDTQPLPSISVAFPPVPDSAPSARSLRDTQALPSISDTFPPVVAPARLDSYGCVLLTA
ncbi:hypothetical protein DFH09DRAFT_1355799 [Mycena vulgaris]|nr:hypothetical protein DFH09DRAFT_1355799 [Mycena vulgaris]